MVFIGPPEDQTRNKLQAAFSRLGLVDRVRFCDIMAPEQLVGAYSGADLFLFPSRHEGFGNVVIEAMACGCPVVLSDQVGAGDHVKDLAQATVLPRDVEHWTTHLESMMRCGRQRSFPNPAGSETLRARFDPLKMAEAMATFYMGILAAQAPRTKITVT
jgi:glycosyltransferase involved in cell wall biosynthesis